ncbi:MAG: hydantoinase/oxoprolinase family protein [Rhodospirillaceae bacterium]|nr:hydantoinase/oxoprolinase family protein [Rhodospirillaceae bacterium]
MRLGIDVGGTFTDLILYDDENKRLFRAKTPSTPADQSIGVANGVKEICALAKIDPSRIQLVLHGTTVATNAVLEGKGARVGLLVTEGFEYTLHLAKSWTPGPLFGWIVMDKPEPLASLEDTRGIPERLNARGDIIKALDKEAATKLIDELCTSGIEALTISLMHSYANNTHEQVLKQIVAERHPHIPVSLSSDILPEFREYDRAITTVMNDYVRPIMQRYLSRIEGRMADANVKSHLHIVRSDGGLMSAKAAAARPVHTVLSGPAGGVTAVADIAKKTKRPKLLGFDMGGTSTDVTVIIDGEPTITRSTEVGYFPAKVPTLDVRTVGAGGGSIAYASELTKSLRVGPRSAGAVPGPVCYQRGGKEITVSDANAVLGYLPPRLLGGEMALDLESAHHFMEQLGTQIGRSLEETACGVIDIANEVMLGALRVITVQRGLDPRDFGLVAFGGAGPIHGNAIAALLGCFPVIVPPNPGVLSALGFLHADFKNEFVKTFIRSTANLVTSEIWSEFEALNASALKWLGDEGIAPDQQQIKFAVDMRYEQQGFEVSVDITSSLIAEKRFTDIVEIFHAKHDQLYGVRLPVPVEIIALRVVAIGTTPEISPSVANAESTASHALIETLPGYFGGAWVDIPHYDRNLLSVGEKISGPCIIRQYDTTTVVLDAHWAEVDQFRNILIWPTSAGEK